MTHEEILNKVHEALEAKELNFTAKMAETFALVDGVYVPTGRFTPIRDDKKGEDAIIKGNAFSDHYVPIQNEEAFSVLGEMADLADVEFKNVGSWGNGAGIYAQVSLGEITGIGSKDDRVGKYISLVNSHDGTRSLQLLVTPYRFFCQNQISKAVGDAKRNNRLISIHHNIYGQDRLRELAEALKYAGDVFAETEVAYKRLADKVVTMDEVREVVWRSSRLLGQEGLKPKTAERKIAAMLERFNYADNGELDKMTGWNLYNAVQGAFQHGVKKTATYERSLILGGIAQQAEGSLSIVNNVLFEGGMKKTSTAEFDEIFDRVA